MGRSLASQPSLVMRADFSEKLCLRTTGKKKEELLKKTCDLDLELHTHTHILGGISYEKDISFSEQSFGL